MPENWETRETGLWLANDEAAYFAFHNSEGEFIGSAEELELYFADNPIEGVDPAAVDYETVAAAAAEG